MQIGIRKMYLDESPHVSDLMQDVFMAFQGPTTSEEGRSTFLSEFSHEQVENRFRKGNLFIVAHCDEKIVGVIAVRDSSHIFGLFVSPNYQGQKIASKLWHKAFEQCKKENKDNVYTVNASEYAIPVYKKWGFEVKDVRQERKGIEYIPMELCVGS
jgi:predicted GNAT family N-acyltransferase